LPGKRRGIYHDLVKRRILKWTLAGLGILAVAAGAFMVVQIGPRNIIGMLRYDQRREGDLRPGDPAPDVVLTALDGTTSVRLLDHHRARPLVLVFGSFT